MLIVILLQYLVHYTLFYFLACTRLTFFQTRVNQFFYMIKGNNSYSNYKFLKCLETNECHSAN